MKTFLAATALLSVVAIPALAQMAGPPPGASPAGGPVMMAPMGAGQFREMAMISDAFEIQSSGMALQRSRNPAVRRFATVMVRDHQATTAALMGGGPAPAGGPVGALVAAPFQVAGAVVGATAGAVGAVAGAPPGGGGAASAMPVDARHAAMLNQLAGTQGRQFDALYAQMQLIGHQEAVAMYTSYAQAGSDPSLRNFAQQVLPNLEHHLAMAQRMVGRRR